MFDWIRRIFGGKSSGPYGPLNKVRQGQESERQFERHAAGGELPTKSPEGFHLLASEDWTQRWDSVDEMRRSGQKGIDPLVNLLEDPHFDVRQKAADALFESGYDRESLFQRMKTWYSARGWRDGLGLDRIYKYLDLLQKTGGEQAIPILMEILKNPIEDTHLRCRALHVLGAIADPNAIPSIVSALEDDDCSIRLYAAGAMRGFDPIVAGETLASLLTHTDKHVRDAVTYALVEMAWNPKDSSTRLLYAKAIAEHMDWDSSYSIGPQMESVTSANAAIVPILASMVHDGTPAVAEVFSIVLEKLIKCYSRDGWDAFPFVRSAGETIILLLQQAPSRIATKHLHDVLSLEDRQFKLRRQDDGIDYETVGVSQVNGIIRRELARREKA